MIRTVISLFIVFLALLAHAEPPEGRLEEIPVKRLFVPKTGFDNNDRIEVTVEGELPSTCYSIADAVLDKKRSKLFHVRQMAWHDTSGPCLTDSGFNDPIPFTLQVSLGRLDVGEYKVTYQTALEAKEEKNFSVSDSKSGYLDDLFYAHTTLVDTDEFYPLGKPVQITLKGFIPYTCLEFDYPIKSEIQGDVILVFPSLLTNLEQDCKLKPRGFRESLVVKDLKPGRYLVHVRSRGGKAIYRPFWVSAAAPN